MSRPIKPLSPAVLTRRLNKLSLKLQEAQREHDAGAKALLARCPHEWEYHRDPAGGSDSGYICNLCDAQRKTL